MQGLLTNSGVIHHSWDEAGCDRRPVARFLHPGRVALSAFVDDLAEFVRSRTRHRGTRSLGFIEFGTGLEECFDE
jgi:hypothetical protein